MLRSLSLGLVLVACGGPEPVEPVEPVTVGGETNGEEQPATEERDPRELGPNPTFATLVEAARALDARSDAEPSRCLLRPAVDGASGPRLEAEVLVAVRPLPEATPDVLARVEGRGPVRGLSRWGERGRGRMVVLAFTPVQPARVPTAVVFLGRAGARVRSLEEETPTEHAGLLDDAALPQALSALQAEAVWVTADAALPLAAVQRWLGAMGATERTGTGARTVAFAVLLPDGVPLPDAPSHAGTRGLCPDGLPAADDLGGMDPAAAVAALGPFRELAAQCLRMAPAESAGGGRLDVAFRVGTDGQVVDACARTDAVGSEAVRGCVLDALRTTAFPTPDPPGTVQLALPVILHPTADPAPATICR